MLAYDLRERVASYDANMEIMHPNRAKMVEIALDALPMPRDAGLRALDLGVGTGYFTQEFLRRFPNARVLALDAAPTILELGRTRLESVANRVEFITGDFRTLRSLVPAGAVFDAVLSSFALHHLNGAEKLSVAREAHALLAPGGWFLNADIIVAESPEIEARIQELRVAGIVRRAAERVEHFKTPQSTRAFLDKLEADDGDQPQTLANDLSTFASAGFRSVAPLWVEYREAVVGGVKNG
ncbi:MAG TPA: methyltransferase domain-containing protein [Gemmatimonadaceae bacterium]|nr:methyltransferase domain-containing protein [Gemmatimonadaceae bacterium]